MVQHNASVIITTYNSSLYVSNAIESVLGQTDVNTEIIIVDDCSHDHDELVKVISNSYAGIDIRLIKPTSKGNANISRNLGIKKAKHNYIAFLDADDKWEPNHLKASIDFMQSSKLDACFCKVNLVSENIMTHSTAVFTGNLCEFIFQKDGICVTSSLVIAREVFSDTTFDNYLQKHQDWDFSIRLNENYALGQAPHFGLNYTLSTGSNMSSKYNFPASIKFMNETLPRCWHQVFISNPINKLIEQKDYDELVSLTKKIGSQYIFPHKTLGLRNRCILFTAKNIVLFNCLTLSAHFLKKTKELIKNKFLLK